ncbi:hypothetical protein [Deinococcus hopiensis]|uniref:Lipopolysaccharide export system protein LptA n=1 Tax=Deinococcus hopiensis KR-140 TaxID=695939 RepID=A0A1W1VG52_9DEIO|nr:hypothetical protein [Deinococcus hopiensis]SMB92325.1 hypothetical protein SAMN00790413_01525 [Deinococcus hopiensis KR-140]
MKRSLLTLLPLLASVTLGSGQAVTFGGLNVSPRGAQNLNLETGATDFPQGGTATDAKNGVRLVADRMQLRPGERLTAQGATVTTPEGATLKASTIVYDLKSGVVTATGGVTFSDAKVRNLTAAEVVLYAKSDFVAARGGVKADTPALQATTLVFDVHSAQALLSGSPRVGGKAVDSPSLLLTFGGNRLLRSTVPDAAALGRFSPYLK